LENNGPVFLWEFKDQVRSYRRRKQRTRTRRIILNTDQTEFLVLQQFYQFFDSTLANVSFQDKVKIKQISFGVSVKHPTKNTGSNSHEVVIRVKMV